MSLEPTKCCSCDATIWEVEAHTSAGPLCCLCDDEECRALMNGAALMGSDEVMAVIDTEVPPAWAPEAGTSVESPQAIRASMVPRALPSSFGELTLSIPPRAHLPTDAAARKAVPLYTGVFKYFPKALAAIAALSLAGNEQHNPGQPLHWDRSKSKDELDAAARHMLEAGTIDTDGHRHSTKLSWRSLANLEKELEAAEAEANGNR